MKLHQLIQTYDSPSILSKFKEIYHEAGSIKKYEKLLKELKNTIPEEIDISIVITKENDDNEIYFDVSGRHNNPRNKEETFTQGIEFVPWNKWLGMDVSKESLDQFSEKEIIVHCLYEMTFLGFSNGKSKKLL